MPSFENKVDEHLIVLIPELPWDEKSSKKIPVLSEISDIIIWLVFTLQLQVLFLVVSL